MTETESSQSSSSSSSSSSESCRGTFVKLVTNYGLLYEGFLCYRNSHDKTLGLRNAICYGTEERNNDGFQIPSSIDVCNYIFFKTTHIKKIQITPPSGFTLYGYGNLAREEATISKHSPHATKPPLPLIFSSNNPNGAEIRQKIPLSNSNEELSKPQAATDSDAPSDTGSVNDGLLIAQPQYPGSVVYDRSFMPCAQQIHHQAPTNAAFELDPPHSLFSTFPPTPVSFLPKHGGVDLEPLPKDFKQYDLWGGPQGNDNNQGDANSIDESFDMISRDPFDPIGNPFGSIEQPLTPFLPSYQLRELGIVQNPSFMFVFCLLVLLLWIF